MNAVLLKQLGRFLIVGGIFTALDIGLHYVLVFHCPVGGTLLPVVIGKSWYEGLLHQPSGYGEQSHLGFGALKVFTATFAVLNSFFWNRRWTFEIREKAERGRQFAKFMILSIAGMILNASVASAVNSALPATTTDSKRNWLISTAIAVCCVTVWNFLGQRYWAFRKPAPPVSDAA